MGKSNVEKAAKSDFNKYKRMFARKGYDALLNALKSSIDFLEKAEKNLDKGKLTGAHGLEDRSFEELYELAKDQDIPGRSKMTKTQLKKELKKRLYN